MGRVLLYLVVGIVMATVPGCESMPWEKDTMPPVELLEETEAAVGTTAATPAKTEASPDALQMATTQRMKEVPLPLKAKEDLERSYVYESSTLQFGRMVYTIRASMNEVAQFYIDNAPAAGWRLENVKQAEGSAELLFRKEGKKLDISVAPLGIIRGQRLVIQLVPDNQTGAAL